jgi:flagella basal body P-ring formation protein FlgA
MGTPPGSITTICHLGILFWLLGIAPLRAAEEENPLGALREAAREFVAQDLGLREEEIHIPPLDRRARIPVCEAPLSFRWPFPSNATVEAYCASTEERIFLRVTFAEAPESRGAKTGGFSGWQVIATQQAGNVLRLEDLKPAPEALPGSQPYRGPAPDDATRLKVLRPLGAGDLIVQDSVRLERKVLRAEASLAARLRLPHPQLTEAWVPAEGLPGDVLNPDAVPPLVALNRPLAAGSMLRASDLSSAVLVEKGQRVRVALSQGALVLEADLIAEDEGALGEIVVLLNPETGRRLRARVTGPGQADHAP